MGSFDFHVAEYATVVSHNVFIYGIPGLCRKQIELPLNGSDSCGLAHTWCTE